MRRQHLEPFLLGRAGLEQHHDAVGLPVPLIVLDVGQLEVRLPLLIRATILRKVLDDGAAARGPAACGASVAMIACDDSACLQAADIKIAQVTRRAVAYR